MSADSRSGWRFLAGSFTGSFRRVDSPVENQPMQGIGSSSQSLSSSTSIRSETTPQGSPTRPVSTPVSPRRDAFADLLDLKLIFQGGVDVESRPVLVFCACNLPDPHYVSYDRLLMFITAKLDQFVENDYVVVLFSVGGKHRPTWGWLYRAYKALSRKYKKNLKTLHVVHPSLWYRILMDMMNLVISPKFAKKLNYCKTLSELSAFVPLDNLSIPEPVLEHNRTLEAEIVHAQRKTTLSGERIFGVSLSEVLTRTGVPIKRTLRKGNDIQAEPLDGSASEDGLIEVLVPRLIQQLIDYLRFGDNLATEGIFRRSPSSADLKRAKEEIDHGNEVDLEDYGVYVAAVLLKMFFRELPEPIVPETMSDQLKELDKMETEDEKVAFVRPLVARYIPSSHQAVLAYLFQFLAEVASKSSQNLMNPQNLAIVFSPNLIRGSSAMTDFGSLGAANSFVKLAVARGGDIFP